MLGWQAAVASTCFLGGSLIQGLIVLSNSSFTTEPWQLVLLYWASLAFAILVNTYVGKYLPKFETLILILHVFGFFGILIPMVYFAPHGDASDVFTLFLNGGEWSSTGLSFMVGLAGPVYSLLGKHRSIFLRVNGQSAYCFST